MNDPYQAPKSEVLDPPDAAPIARPAHVTLALRLLWLSFVAGVVYTIADLAGERYLVEEVDEDSRHMILLIAVVTSVVLTVIGAWLIVMMGKGRNWARWT